MIDDDATGMDNRAENALKLAMARLKDDFRHILVNNTIPLGATRLHRISMSLVPCSSHRFQTATVPPLNGINSEVHEDVSAVSLELNGELDNDLVHPAAISELKKIADRMIQSGYGKECCLVYSSVRSHVLDECLRILGIEKYTIEKMQKMEWTTLYDQMKNWIQALKILVKRLLIDEKFLCEQVFAGSESMREVCFVESAKGCVMQMLNIGKAVAIYKMSSENLFRIFDTFDVSATSKRSTEKLFRIFDDVAIYMRSSNNLFSILDIYDALSDAMPDLEELFNGDSGAGEIVCVDAKGVLDGLCEAAIGTFGELERVVREKTPASWMLENGDIHPLTRYLLSYMRLLVIDYSEILNGILEKTDYNPEQLQNDEVENVERMPCITRRLLSLIKSWDSNLEDMSRMYEDCGLQYVFLMNNVLYIVNELKDPLVRNLLGDECISKRRDQIRHCAVGYLRSSWTETLNCLHVEGWTESWVFPDIDEPNKALKTRIKVNFKKFNEYFEDTYRIQTAWKVADPQLREELRILILEKLVHIYRTFLKRYAPLVRICVKYTADDLSNYLLDLFEGTPRTIQTTEKNLPKKDWLCLCS